MYEWQPYEMKKVKARAEALRKAVRLPEERALRLPADRVKHFLYEVRACAPKDLQSFADRLPAERLVYLFEAIATTLDENSLNRLFYLVRRRASWLLYGQAWSAVQKYFPDQYILQAFRLLGEELKKQGLPRPAFWQEDVVEDVLEAPSEDFLFERLYQAFRDRKVEELEALRQRYRYEEPSALWQALLGQYFIDCPPAEMAKAGPYLSQLLPVLHPYQAKAILERIAHSERLLTEQKQSLSSYILTALPILAPVHPFWETADPQLQRYFLQYAVRLCLEAHCGASSDKYAFYQPHFSRILDIARLSEEAIALRFPTFILVDNAKIPTSIYYFTNEAVERLLQEGLDQEVLTSPNASLPTPGPQYPAEDLLNEPALRLELSPLATKEAHVFLNRKFGELYHRKQGAIPSPRPARPAQY